MQVQIVKSKTIIRLWKLKRADFEQRFQYKSQIKEADAGKKQFTILLQYDEGSRPEMAEIKVKNRVIIKEAE